MARYVSAPIESRSDRAQLGSRNEKARALRAASAILFGESALTSEAQRYGSGFFARSSATISAAATRAFTS